MRYGINRADVEIVPFRGSGPGGQHRNKTATCIRMRHKPTAIVVRATSERSLSANLENAYRELSARLENLAEEKTRAKRQAAYRAKPDAAFSAQIRTYRLCGSDQGVTDHRTGHDEPSTRNVLNGHIDGLLRAGLLA
jgi:protein subunit release factor B